MSVEQVAAGGHGHQDRDAFVRARPDDLAALETRTGAFTELNVQAGYRAQVGKTELSLFARGSNLLDETQRRHVSLVKDLAPRPGIAGLIGVRLRY